MDTDKNSIAYHCGQDLQSPTIDEIAGQAYNDDLDSLLESYDYEIPKELIAQKPADKRDESKLFVIDKTTRKFEHKKFNDITDYFKEGEVLVINDTKVIPSRLFGKKPTGAKVELLFLEPHKQNQEYKVLMKPFIGIDKKAVFEDGYECIVKSKNEKGEVFVEFNKPTVSTLLQKSGLMPLPPYINRKDNLALEFSALDRERYQTIYARNFGAIAAPTAGLHFTQNILDKLQDKGVKIAKLSLHVGWGTFKPIISKKINNHQMLSERFSIDEKNADIINEAIRRGQKITSVGTTTTRALESLAKNPNFNQDGQIYIKQFSGETSIFIYPSHNFRIINKLITNLHLPKSTPLMMASAFAGRGLILEAYKEAVKEKYRFFSYGDSMLIL
ncbi:MAG: tRNA preQ1(34) S-adenosylmethionine ribosyltransferase-isomerase QueA [Elusimicrobiota bacterium]|jgi:S-adenosylmethionine:tRNA ribosyltransferase-isomerase|nr:tRNA preQ1(34) S-adenosylmethionine ribosyltransferase-isomerase QueA [Elusimicrobiota bacterium]